MKILIICHEFPPVGGGAANAAFYIAGCLKNKHHDITVLTSKFRRAARRRYDFNIVYLPVLRRHIDRTSPLELISFAVSGIIYGLGAVRRSRYDICLAIHGIPSGWAALVMSKLFKVPYVVSLRGGDVPGFLPREYDGLHKKVRILTRLYWKSAKSIIANSEGLKRLSEVTADRLGRNVKVIPNGVDCRTFKPDYSLRNNQVITIVYSGRITSQKGLDSLIEAVKLSMPRIKNDFNIKIIGDGPLRAGLECASSELRSKGIMTFSGWTDKQGLIMEYKKAHIFILPSSYEGMSNSLLEAMACGCMVIASNIPGNRELVKKFENGFLFEPGDCPGLAEILAKVLNSGPSLLELMGRKSRTIAENFSWDKTADLYLKEFYA